MRIAPVVVAALSLTPWPAAHATSLVDQDTGLIDMILINRPASPFEDGRAAASRILPLWYGDHVHLDPYCGSLMNSGALMRGDVAR